MLTPLDAVTIERIVRMALAEDAPWGDATSQAFVPAEARMSARLAAREAGVLSGADVFTAAMHLSDPTIVTTFHVADGAAFAQGDLLATIDGPARGILHGERVALNLIQRMSGIATLTAVYVANVMGTHARILDTRKTTPGLRALERYAVRCGGGCNHRFSLSDAVMVKDNHLTTMGSDVTGALLAGKSRLSHTTHVEVEVDRIDQIEPVLAAGVDTILLDNFTAEQVRSAVQVIAGRALVEASGGVNLDTVRGLAEAGADLISVGALTHSVRALDLGLDV